jgi:copper transport protein
MAPLSTTARRSALFATLVVLFLLLFPSPAAAHAELVSTSPGNGEQLRTPPTDLRLTFTESVNLVDDGIRLVDHVGAIVVTSEPSVRGRTVIWPMPSDLPEGPYVVTWRVVSSDGHPVNGAFSFGVGTSTAAVPGSATAPETAGMGDSAVAAGSTAPWPVVVIRLAGYIAFALVVGVAAFVLFCAPGTSKDLTLQLLVRCGLMGGAVAAVAAILVQGPYTAGVSMSRVLDMRLLPETLSTPFGTAMMWRLALYGVLGVLAWRLPRILTEVAGWLVPALVVGIAVTIAAAGHAAASGPLSLLVDAGHALTAGLWVGGLIALAAIGRSVERHALHKFSTLALASVLTLIVTGTLNSLRHLTAVEQLWSTRYGLTLFIKLTLVAGALAVAAVSRRHTKQDRVPVRSVRLEATLTVAVLVLTALLTMTAPPPEGGPPTTHTGHGHEPAAVDDTVQMSLGDQGNASLAVVPATTAGSHLHLALKDPNGQKLSATRVTLKVTNPARDVAAILIPMSMRDGVWVANWRFPFPGTWKAILTVDGVGRLSVVASADITIRD